MAKFEGKQLATAKVVTEQSLAALISRLMSILAPERSFYWLALVYGIAISLLSLATPVSVQILINSVINTGLTAPLVVISSVLFVLLLCYGLLNALRIHLVDVFGRRFYARTVSEIALRTIYAINPYFEDGGQTSLFNRYFDIIIVIKVVPYLLVGGFTIVMQAIVGFVLVSFYHPYFLAFNIFIVGLLILVWVIWGRRAMHTAVELSHSKHETAAWLENIGNSNGFYNAENLIEEALKQTENFTAHYMKKHIKHFRMHFSQSISLFVLYAFGSAVLLGLGGWLVLQSQLNIGQLVAAELILSIVFYSIAQFGVYLTYFYDLCGAIDELSLFYAVKAEDSTNGSPRPESSEIIFHNVVGKQWNQDVMLDFQIPADSRVIVQTESRSAEQLLLDILKGNVDDYGGFFSVGGIDSMAINKYTLRREVAVLDRPRIVSISIRNYLSLCAEEVRPEQILEAIEAVGLEKRIAELDDGIDTTLAVSGWPLNVMEVMQLKLAAVILAKPCIVVLGDIYDILPEDVLTTSLDFLRKSSAPTVLYFTTHSHECDFDYVMRLKAGKEELIQLVKNDC